MYAIGAGLEPVAEASRLANARNDAAAAAGGQLTIQAALQRMKAKSELEQMRERIQASAAEAEQERAFKGMSLGEEIHARAEQANADRTQRGEQFGQEIGLKRDDSRQRHEEFGQEIGLKRDDLKQRGEEFTTAQEGLNTRHTADVGARLKEMELTDLREKVKLGQTGEMNAAQIGAMKADEVRRAAGEARTQGDYENDPERIQNQALAPLLRETLGGIVPKAAPSSSPFAPSQNSGASGYATQRANSIAGEEDAPAVAGGAPGVRNTLTADQDAEFKREAPENYDYFKRKTVGVQGDSGMSGPAGAGAQGVNGQAGAMGAVSSGDVGARASINLRKPSAAEPSAAPMNAASILSDPRMEEARKKAEIMAMTIASVKGHSYTPPMHYTPEEQAKIRANELAKALGEPNTYEKEKQSADAEAQMKQHFGALYQQYIQGGMNPTEATQQAVIKTNNDFSRHIRLYGLKPLDVASAVGEKPFAPVSDRGLATSLGYNTLAEAMDAMVPNYIDKHNREVREMTSGKIPGMSGGILGDWATPISEVFTDSSPVRYVSTLLANATGNQAQNRKLTRLHNGYEATHDDARGLARYMVDRAKVPFTPEQIDALISQLQR